MADKPIIGNDTNIAVAKAALRAALELHAAHINGTEPTTGPKGEKSQQRLMDLIETAFKALGGVGGPGGM